MKWNYRVIKTQELGEAVYAIHEVYYHEDGSLVTYTDKPVPVVWFEEDNALSVINAMKEGMFKPVLTEEDFK